MQVAIQTAATALHNTVVGYNAAVSMGKRPLYGTKTSIEIMAQMTKALKRYLALPIEDRPPACELLYPSSHDRSISKRGWPISEVNDKKQQLWLLVNGQLLLTTHEPEHMAVSAVERLGLDRLELEEGVSFTIKEIACALKAFCSNTPVELPSAPASRLIVAPPR